VAARRDARGIARGVADPRLATSEADDRARYDLLIAIRDKLTKTHEAIVRIREVRDQVRAAAERAKASAADTSVTRSAERLVHRLTAVEEALYQTKNRSSQDPLNFPIRLNNKLSLLGGTVAGTEGRPTDQQQMVLHDLARRIDDQLATFEAVTGPELTAFNRLMHERDVPAVVARGAKEPMSGP
jgi:hypothetical protein